MYCGKQNFLILKVDRRWSPMIADAPKNLVIINGNSSAMVTDEIAGHGDELRFNETRLKSGNSQIWQSDRYSGKLRDWA